MEILGQIAGLIHIRFPKRKITKKNDRMTRQAILYCPEQGLVAFALCHWPNSCRFHPIKFCPFENRGKRMEMRTRLDYMS